MNLPLARLGELAVVRGGKTPRALDRYLKDYPRNDRLVPFYKVGDLGTSWRLRSARTMLSEVDLGALGIRSARVGTVVFPKAGGAIATNKKRIIERPGPVDLNCMTVTPGPALDPWFLLYWFSSFDLTSIADGSVLPQISARRVADLLVPAPQIKRQRQVVEILADHLSRLDAADAELRRAQVRRSALLLGALRRHVDAARSAGVSFARIGEVASTNLGKMLDAKKATGEMTPYLANINVRWGHFDLENLKSVPLTTEEQARLTMQPGDIIVCEGGEPGRCAVWDRDNSNIAYQKALHRVRVHDPQRLRPEYLALMLRETIQSGRADRLFTGTTIKHLPQEKLRLIEVPVPEPSAQASALRELREVAECVDRLTATLQAATARSEALRRAVLTAAFEGLLTGRCTDDEIIEEMADSHREGA